MPPKKIRIKTKQAANEDINKEKSTNKKNVASINSPMMVPDFNNELELMHSWTRQDTVEEVDIVGRDSKTIVSDGFEVVEILERNERINSAWGGDSARNSRFIDPSDICNDGQGALDQSELTATRALPTTVAPGTELRGGDLLVEPVHNPTSGPNANLQPIATHSVTSTTESAQGNSKNTVSIVPTQRPSYFWNYPLDQNIKKLSSEMNNWKNNPEASKPIFVSGSHRNGIDLSEDSKLEATVRKPAGSKQAWEYWGKERPAVTPSSWGKYHAETDVEEESGNFHQVQSGWYMPRKLPTTSYRFPTHKGWSHSQGHSSLKKPSTSPTNLSQKIEKDRVLANSRGDSEHRHGWRNSSQIKDGWAQSNIQRRQEWDHSNTNEDIDWDHTTAGHINERRVAEWDSEDKGWDHADGDWGAISVENQDHAEDHDGSGSQTWGVPGDWNGNHSNMASSMPSKTMTFACNGNHIPTLDNLKIQENNTSILESHSAALVKVQMAIFGGERKAKERIHWMFSPDKDARVRALMSWITATECKLGSYGLHKFLQNRERGALFVNADYRMESHPNEPCFDWLTFDQIQQTKDSIIQNSTIQYDPATMVYIFVFLPSGTGKSVAMWRRRVGVPRNTCFRFQKEINDAKRDLNKKDYMVYVDELPPNNRKLKNSSYERGQSLTLPPKKKKRKWWQVLRFAE